MPWKVTDVMQERIRFAIQVLRDQEKLSELCRRFGISRSTGYVWWNRYLEERTVGALQDRSRRPHRSPHQTPELVEQRVVQLRHRYGWGGKKLLELLQQEGLHLSVPTVNRIIRRQGLVRAEASHHPALKRFERQAPNELWQMDFKGPYRGQGKPCIPLSILDDHSRYAVGLYALQDLGTKGVLASVRHCFQHYGLPQAMSMDHGVPWWSNTNGHGLTRFSVHLIQQGIRLIYGGVAHPQTQGKVERFHRTLAEAVYHQGRPRQLQHWQKFLEHFRQEYNSLRPHEALNMAVPASRYQPSPRACSPRPQPYTPVRDVLILYTGGSPEPLARTIHKPSAAAAGSSVRTVRPASGYPSLDLLGVLQEYASGGLGRDVAQRTPAAASAASRRQLVSNPG